MAAVSLHVANFFGTRNKGDEAMLRGLVELLASKHPGAHLTVSCLFRDSAGEAALLEEFPHLTFVSSVGSKKSQLDGLVIIIILLAARFGWRTLMFALLKLRHPATLQAIERSQAVFATGGPFFSANFSEFGPFRLPRFNLAAPLVELYIARAYKKPIAIVGQSFGEGESASTHWLMKPILTAATLVAARERSSASRAQRIVSDKRLIRTCPDLAFAPSTREPNSPRPMQIAVNLRRMSEPSLQYLFDAYQDRGAVLYRRYLTVVAGALNAIYATEPLAHFVFLNQAHDNDMHAAHEITSLLHVPTERCEIQRDGTSFHELYGTIQSSGFVIATRYHCTVFAAKAGVPFVSIAYGEKLTSALADYGLSDCALRGDRLTSLELAARYSRRHSGVPSSELGPRLAAQLRDSILADMP